MTVRSLMLSAIAVCAALAAVMPGTAGAYATLAPPPNATGVAGLPDGRVYEEVSPPNKYGNEVQRLRNAGLVTADGEAVMYKGTGPLADASTSGIPGSLYVSRRTSHGWVTRATMPLAAPGVSSEEENLVAGGQPEWFEAASDLSHLAFQAYTNPAYVGLPDERGFGNNLYLEGPEPFAEPEWVGRSLIEGAPAGVEDVAKNSEEGHGSNDNLFIAGGSPSLSTLYFWYGAFLLPEASHLYEYRDGVLSDAGTLPGGEASPYSAAPAAQPLQARAEFNGMTPAAAFDNEVSSDGSRVFFIRRDAAGTLELYVHQTATDGTQSTTLISASQLPGHEGEPAPHGPVAMPSTEWMNESLWEEASGQESPPSYVYASPDGSHAFFQSVDRLAEAAPEDGTTKTYDFDLETGMLEYLPAITGSVVTSSRDGSSLVFENTATTPFELDRWVAGTGGGSVTAIAQLPAPATNACGAVLCVGPAYTSSDGSVVVFGTESPIAGFNDGGTHYTINEERGGARQGEPEGKPLSNKEIFRYDAGSDELSCVSCPPAGVTPSGDAVISELDQHLNDKSATGGAISVTDTRAMSADGSRVFFDTPDALVSQDVNGVRDVYEWENGAVYLLSSGRSPERSYLLGSSETGDDAFFTTAEGIAEGDTDGSRDLYDARVPRPGDAAPPAALPCEGDTCQGAPSVPSLLASPASATFHGVGNLTQPTATKTVHVKRGSRHKRVHRRRPHNRRHHKKKGRMSRRHQASGALTGVKRGTRRGN